MNTKTKNIIRKIIYGILFIVMAGAFVYLSEKYAGNSEVKILSIGDYYSEVTSEKFEVINGSVLISKLKSGKHLIFIGSKTSPFSQKYITELESIISEIDKVDKIYYYDLNNDKSQKNSSYYKIRELLSGSLITTDGSSNNLLAPSFYIIDNGKVKYYNIETTAVKNSDEVNDYWTEEQENNFKEEIIEVITKYYLN